MPKKKKKKSFLEMIRSLPTGFIQTRAQTFKDKSKYTRKKKHRNLEEEK